MNVHRHWLSPMWLLCLMVGLLPMLWVPISDGQTTSIRSSGLPSGLDTRVTLGSARGSGGQNYDIKGGTRPGDGTNLFHSFVDFSVGTNDGANFVNDSGLATTNILSRVTGGNVSSIFGEINTTDFGPLANLYLINPAGVVFGRGADLNVGGSVRVSTADYLKLGDEGVRFNAAPGPQDALLSTAPVTAFGFLHATPQPISVNGAELSVRNDLSLIAGDITITGGQLSAPGAGLGGQIDLVSVASPNEVTPVLTQTGVDSGFRGNILLAGTPPRLSNQSDLGTIRLSDEALVSAFGGTIHVRAGNLVIDHARIDAGSTLGGGEIVILASGDVLVRDSPTALSVHGSNALGFGTRAGTVQVVADRVRFIDSGIDASGTLRGAGFSEDFPFLSNILIFGDQAVRIEGDSRINAANGRTASTEARSRAAIEILGDNTVRILDGAVVTAGGDQAGDQEGGFGEIHILARNDLVVNGGQIDIRASGPHGEGGEVLRSLATTVSS